MAAREEKQQPPIYLATTAPKPPAAATAASAAAAVEMEPLVDGRRGKKRSVRYHQVSDGTPPQAGDGWGVCCRKFVSEVLQVLSPRMLILLAALITLVFVNHNDSQALSHILQKAASWNWLGSTVSTLESARAEQFECRYYNNDTIHELIVATYNLSSVVAQCCINQSSPEHVLPPHLAFIAEQNNNTCQTYPCRYCFYLMQHGGGGSESKQF